MSPAGILQLQKARFASGATRGIDVRRELLRALISGLEKHEGELLDALRADLGKSPMEAYTSEIQLVLDEAAHALKHLKAWMKPVAHGVPFLARPGRVKVHREPCGIVLIIGPWNYPLQLLFTPLVGVLAAGGTAILKPSEFAPSVAAVIGDLIADTFDPAQVAVINGDAAVANALLEERFDHIFFTGSAATGRKVMAAAVKHLTPVTLELGGKCPALVFPGARTSKDLLKSIDVIARRIAWGKYLNAGQTCVAPDHVLVAKELHDPLVEALGRAFTGFGMADHGRIVNRRHFDRLESYLADGRIACGGGRDVEKLSFEPTVLVGVDPAAAVMQEEIFGPILPVIACDSPDEALELLQGQPAPLAVYAFTGDPELTEEITRRTISGGVCFNDTVVHITGPELPFGGIGESGMGRYRGRASFETFTRERVVMRRPLWIDLPFRYPPPKIDLKRLKLISRFFGE